MITNYFYNSDFDKVRQEIKALIRDNNYEAIDVGAAMNFWSYPECVVMADAYPVDLPDVWQIHLDFEKKNTWNDLLSYVKQNGPFEFSVCSHTLEDVFNPMDLMGLLMKISEKGVILVPSKFDEFSYLYDQPYKGNAHHKQFFDVHEEKLTIYPKYSFIVTDQRAEEIRVKGLGKEPVVFWEREIPHKIFGEGKPFRSDAELINTYFKMLDQ